MFSRPKILFLVSLLIEFNPYLPFEFLIFYHSSLFSFYTYYAFIIHNNNLSAGAQNVTGAYVTTHLHGKAAV